MLYLNPYIHIIKYSIYNNYYTYTYIRLVAVNRPVTLEK